ncbi:FAD/NAD(P)-binding domain-containing protein [Pleomassaria siparia CBS 279.74]|uniref:FAD/NAD(P)-binding domain-containing protein n=1 Tax=Pleomassaria siparia CBS 279.74 TaxID=1314801 RepID=A0A6G1JTG2_9PLEO|nr:FAD/NAD(P)-binding domain-containing protein [Pleomassaria siparia CBS 279.74]
MRVLISGAGIAGPALVFWLAKAGAHITVVEKAPSLLPYGQNVDITGSARSVIKKMGLKETVLQHNTTEKGSIFIDPKGRPFAPFPVREGSAASLTSEWEILRGDLTKVLWEATKESENVEYLFGTTVNRVISNDEECVKVELSNGETYHYDLLVAADGQWSKVRKQCFPSESITVLDKNMYVGYWTIPRLPEDNDWWNIYQALRSRIITLRPDPHGTIRAMFTLMPCNPEQKKAWQSASKNDRQTQEDLLRKEFADAGWQAHRLLDAMDTAPDFYFQAVQQIKMDTWSRGRVICLGDTAFAPTPLTGMGTSLAITGAYMLAGELSKLQPSEHPARALEAYENRFRHYVEETQIHPSWVPGVAHPETELMRWMFGLLISAISWLVSIEWLVRRFGKDDDLDDFVLPVYAAFDGQEKGQGNNGTTFVVGK